MWKRLVAWWNQTIRDKPYRIGTRLGHYTIDSVLGMGSYGIAYRARHDVTGELIVLKQVKPSLRRSPKGEAMQAYEQRILQALCHPQIPRFIERFHFQGNAFLAMSYIDGPTLEELLFDEQAVVGESEAARYMLQIGELVSYVHRHGIIHRDVRIPNVIWQNGTPYLIDFGLARFCGDSPTYSAADMSSYPEEKQLKRHVEPASDLYALGHFFLFLLYTGYQPGEDQPERSWEEELTLRPEVAAMIRRLLQIDRGYADVDEWLCDLKAIIQSQTRKKSSTPSP
ncbi:serine/threonine protein kinase [Brevibacillus borstelensis]|uniref:serine/threonine protein kinase n=1 Tax=Brevibacillus borstelensis TaxID=45462 RepID=UPI0030BEFA32